MSVKGYIVQKNRVSRCFHFILFFIAVFRFLIYIAVHILWSLSYLKWWNKWNIEMQFYISFFMYLWNYHWWFGLVDGV